VDKRWTNGYLARNKYSRRIEVKNSPIRVSSTLSGRPLSTLDRTSILNHQDQGSGAEIALKAINMLPEEWRRRVVNFVHDEIMLEVPETEAERAAAALKTAMVAAGDWLLGPFGIPTEVDVAIGKPGRRGRPRTGLGGHQTEALRPKVGVDRTLPVLGRSGEARNKKEDRI